MVDCRTLFRRVAWTLLLCCSVATGAAASDAPNAYKLLEGLPYRTGDSLTDYQRERCRLDLYAPTDKRGFATVVWFHGGGLTGGERSVPVGLREQGIAVAAASYRLHPRVKEPAYIEDAAAAVAWTINNVERLGGSPDRVYVAGHSAGGYLTSMVGLDKRWLAAHDIDANRLAGLIPYSGHTITHFTVRKERGIPNTQPVVDALAPLYHVRPDAPPLLLITGDRELEMLGRYEENAYLWRMMRQAGHKAATLRELKGRNHGQMVEPAHPMLLSFIHGKLAAHAPRPPKELLRRSIGQYLTIEGTPAEGRYSTGMLAVDTIDGEKLTHPVPIDIRAASPDRHRLRERHVSLTSKRRYTFKGYVSGRMVGVPPAVREAAEDLRWDHVPQGKLRWAWRPYFVVLDAPGKQGLRLSD